MVTYCGPRCGRPLPVVAQVPGAEAEGLRSLAVNGRTLSGRVATLDIVLRQRTVSIDGPAGATGAPAP